MSKANRTCYCCGREYYYCPSCNDRRNPKIYTMWDSELCKEIFTVLTNESFKKITTLECKKKLIELGVDENTVLKDSVKKHVDRVMAYKEETIEENKNDVVEEIVKNEVNENETLTDSIKENTTVETILSTNNIKKAKRTRKSSFKNKENSEVD